MCVCVLAPTDGNSQVLMLLLQLLSLLLSLSSPFAIVVVACVSQVRHQSWPRHDRPVCFEASGGGVGRGDGKEGCRRLGVLRPLAGIIAALQYNTLSLPSCVAEAFYH